METLDGSTIQLHGTLSTRQLTMTLDAEGDTWELDMSRDQVVQLRDQLNAWLTYGQLT